MNADKTPDAPRACDFDYHAPEVLIPDLREMRSVVADNAAELIEELLARLTAAEADADRLACAVGWPPIGGVVEVLRLHDEALALRERPS